MSGKQVMDRTPEGMAVMTPGEDMVEKQVQKVATEMQVGPIGEVSVVSKEEVLPKLKSVFQMQPGVAAGGMVTTVPVGEETSWTELKHSVKVREDVKAVVDSLVGQAKEKAAEVLEALVKEAKLSGVRFIQAGQSFTTDVVPGRVQMLVGKDGNVQSVQVG